MEVHIQARRPAYRHWRPSGTGTRFAPRTSALMTVVIAVLVLAACGGQNAATQTPPQSSIPSAEPPSAEPSPSQSPTTASAVGEVLADLEVPQVQSMAGGGDTTSSEQATADFMTLVLENIQGVWAEVFRNSDLPEPTVSHRWLEAGEVSDTACVDASGDAAQANDRSTFYCPADDTIYFGLVKAMDLWNGLYRGTQSEALGDFSLAYIVAHEYGHNVQAELAASVAADGVTVNFDPPENQELQADCFAGVWGYAVNAQGLLDEGDPLEAIEASWIAGDFIRPLEDPHGTPAERTAAWSVGYNSGVGADCARYELSETQTTAVNFAILNNSSVEICYAYLSPSASTSWGQDILGSDVTMPPGSRADLSVPTGLYDLLLTNCDEEPLIEAYELDVSTDFEYTVTD